MTAPFGGYNSEPTIPGPFSFLQGAGNIIAAHEQYKEHVIQQAQDTAAKIIQMRNMGLVKPEDFADPKVQEIFRTAGLPVPSTDPTLQEQTAAATQGVLRQGTTTPIPSAAISAAGGPPAAATPVRAPLKPSAYSPEAKTLLNLPSTAAATAGSQSQPSEDVQANGLADRLVQSYYTQFGRLPTVAQGMELASKDLRVQAFKDAAGNPIMNPDYIGAAIERQRQQLEGESEKRAAVGAKTSEQDAKAVEAQQQRVLAQLDALDKSDADLTKTYSLSHQADGVDNASDLLITQKLRDNQTRRVRLQNQLDDYNNIGGRKVAGTPSAGTQGDILTSRANWDASFKALLRKLNDPTMSPWAKQQIANGRAAHQTDQQIATTIASAYLGPRP